MKDQKIKESLRSLGIFYWFLFLSNISIVVISAWFVNNLGIMLPADPQTSYIVSLVLIALLILLAPVSYLVPQKMIGQIDKSVPLLNKLTSYRLALLIRFIAMNSAGFLIAIGFMLNGNTNLMYLQLIVILFFIIYRPTPFKIAADLELEEDEKRQLFD